MLLLLPVTACLNQANTTSTLPSTSTAQMDQPLGSPTISLTEVVQTAEALGFIATFAPTSAPTSDAIDSVEPTWTSMTVALSSTPIPIPPTATRVPPLSPEYLDPEGSLAAAFEQAFGQPVPSLYLDLGFMQDAQWLPGLFHLMSAPVSQFNFDTTHYYEWLVEFVRWRYGTDHPDTKGYQAHATAQFLNVVSEPTSDVARTLALLLQQLGATSVDVEFEFYFQGFYMPIQTAFVSYWDATRLTREAWDRRFPNMRNEFAAARYNDPAHVPDFPTFLRLNPDYFPYGIEEQTAASEASPSQAPSRSDGSTQPPDGEILYDRPLTEWFEEDTEEGWFAVEGGTFHIGMYQGNGRTREAWTASDDFADISASVNVRQVTNDTNSGGCLAVRQHVDEGEYQLCILNNGLSWATYDFVDSAGAWHSEDILAASERGGTNASTSWNELKIVARGTELWFLINGHLLGSTTHEGRSTGHIAIQITNWGADTVEWEFNDLVVRAVE
jgi:hypothetical protein